MSVTQTQRNRYHPPCAGKGSLYLGAYEALNAVMQRYGYRIRGGVTGAYNCRKITGGTGYSLHAYGPGDRFTFWTGVVIATSLAVDINWDKNPYGPRLITDMPRNMVEEILAIRCNNGEPVWGWGGNYSRNKDAMHYEIICSQAGLRSGIRGHTVPVPKPPSPTGDWAERMTTVKQNSRHPHVATLQALLNGTSEIENAGWPHVKVDAHFGGHTHNVVLMYQHSRGLKADGIVGNNTWTKLLALG